MSKLIPYTLSQNPAPNPANQGQAYQQDKNALVQDIMAANTVVIPLHYWLDITLVSNNVSGYLAHQAWGPIWNAYELDVAAAN